MSVTQNCGVSNEAITLKLSAGQKVRYTVAEDAGVHFNLLDQNDKPLLASADTARTRLWPADASENPTGSPVSHALGVQFGEAGKLSWKVELLGADGTLLSVQKDCTYSNSGGTGDHFDGITIFIR